MMILVSGASGLIGSALAPFLASGGREIVPLTRGGNGARSAGVRWDPQAGTIDRERLAEIRPDAVVHLSGEDISHGRWTRAKKARIRSSRVDGTALLVSALCELRRPPQTLIAASAIGYYGNRGDEVLTEASPPGSDFLAGVCRDWEAVTAPAAECGIRVVNARIGVVLSGAGGALGAMLTPFKLGAGGPIGDGRQYLSWIAIDDVVAAVQFALTNPSISGPLNLASPEPVPNAEFARALGKVLSRPAVLPLPATAVRLLFGEMGDALLLSSTRVIPQRLVDAGFRFRFPTLEPALRHVLGQ
ncbi:MAG: TIGR01777 family oxidoreductase [Candidatus Binatia bacterium]